MLARRWSTRTGIAVRWSNGLSMKPWIWPLCRSTDSSRPAPAAVNMLAISLAVMGSRGSALRSWRP